MTTEQSKEELIAELDQSVRETLSYFEGIGQASEARIDQWGAWEVLAHLPYWHYATAWGIESGTAGGPPWLLSAGADELNATCLKLHEGESFEELISQLERAQERLVRATQGCVDLDADALGMPGGRMLTVRERLRMITGHWRNHARELDEAAG
ncbi:MAG: hypothetical protein QF664_07680 [Dehalococcoidia bacterium]|nr:hypothetical protein [Dehalococcoidia bacterium]